MSVLGAKQNQCVRLGALTGLVHETLDDLRSISRISDCDGTGASPSWRSGEHKPEPETTSAWDATLGYLIYIYTAAYRVLAVMRLLPTLHHHLPRTSAIPDKLEPLHPQSLVRLSNWVA